MLASGSGAAAASQGRPVVRSAKVYPVEVSLESMVRVDVQGEDAQGSILAYKYQWLVNELPVTGATAPQFSLHQLRKGDRIQVEVTASDGKLDGRPYVTVPVTIGNTPPEIDQIVMEPTPLHRGDNLRARVFARDPDGDPIKLSYHWFRNGKEIPAVQNETLDTKVFRKKDVLAVLVTPSDGKGTRQPTAGAPVTIENSPPRITSTPPTTIIDGQYLYQVNAIDPDDDPITYELKQAPVGMIIDAATGKLVWKLTPESKGKHRVLILAKDNDKATAQQDFELEGQTPPTSPAPE